MTTALVPAPAKTTATFTIDADQLVTPVTQLAKLARGMISMAPSVTFAFKDQRVVISATDFDTAAMVKLPVKGKRAKTVSVDAVKLGAFAKSLRGTVTIDVADHHVTLTAGTAEFVLPVMAEAAVFNFTDPVNPLPLDVPAFTRIARTLAPVASTDPARPILTAINFDGDVAVATDSYRLGVQNDAPGFTALIGAPAAKLAAALVDGHEATYDLEAQRITFRTATVTFTTRLVAGEFPNWKSLVPTAELPHKATIDKAALLHAVQIVQAADSDAPIRMVLAEGKLTLTVTSSTNGATAEAEIPADGELPKLALNGSYLRSGLGPIGDSQIVLTATDSLKPVLFTDGTGVSQWTVLQMPVRVP